MNPNPSEVKHIDLDTQDKHVKQFVLSLDLQPEGSLLEVDGRAIARVLPVEAVQAADREKLKAAILARRDESHTLNKEWEHADREVFDRPR